MRRIIVAAILRNNEGQILMLIMADDRGVFPGQWGLVGGGIDEGEMMAEALRREVMEETGLEIGEIEPFRFADDRQMKLMSDGSKEEVYMIYLVFDAKVVGGELKLNEELSEARWVDTSELSDLDLNPPTRETFRQKGWVGK